MLKYRIITAAILVPITLIVLFYLPPLAFFIMTSIVMFGAAWEWTGLMGLQEKSKRWLYLLAVMLLMGWALFLPMKIIFIAAFVWWIVAIVLIRIYPELGGWWGSGYILRGLMGFLVLVPCWVAINFIRNQNDGIYTLFFLFVLIWGADSAAYFVGKKWGRTKLAPLVSPGKSREGVLGALLFSTLIAVAALYIGQFPTRMWIWAMVLSLITVMFSIVGDLFESMMKRQIGVKDSGSLLPGHGGILDRIDSLTSAAPVFVLGGLIMSKYLH